MITRTLHLFEVGVLLAVIALGPVGCAAYRGELASHEARITDGSSIADTAVGPIQYADVGEGPAVLVLHGAGGGFDQGVIVGEMLLGDDRRVIAPSRFGYLDTPLPEDSGDNAQAEAHAALIEALGIERVAVIGFSAGAYSAVAFARQHPERVSALILVVPALGPTESRLANFALRNPFVFGMVGGFSDFGYWALSQTSRPLVLRLIGVPPDVYAAARAEERAFADRLMDSVMPVNRRLAGVENDARTLQGLEPDAPDALDVPVLAICARDDTLVGCGPAEQAAAAGSETRLEAFETGGHLLLGRQAEARAVVGAFLSRVGWR